MPGAFEGWIAQGGAGPGLAPDNRGDPVVPVGQDLGIGEEPGGVPAGTQAEHVHVEQRPGRIEVVGPIKGLEVGRPGLARR